MSARRKHRPPKIKKPRRKLTKEQRTFKDAGNLITGVIIRYTICADKDEKKNYLFTHRNQTIRSTMSAPVWKKAITYIFDQREFLWRIDITAAFKYPNGLESYESRRLIARAKLGDLRRHADDTVKEVERYGLHHVETRFDIECLGNRSAKDDDFEDYE